MARVIENIIQERRRQTEKWGNEKGLLKDGFPWYIKTKVSVLGEEFGEICRAVNDKDLENLYEETIQVAAVAAAMAEGILEWANQIGTSISSGSQKPLPSVQVVRGQQWEQLSLTNDIES